MEELAKKIETTYEELLNSIKKVNALSQTIEDLKNTTNEIIEKYTDALDQSKIEKAKQSSEKNLQVMIEDIKKIEALMNSVEVAKQNVADLIMLFTTRMNTLDETLKNTRKPIQEIDQKLIKYFKEAEKNADLGMKRFNQAAQVVEAKEEIQKYEELISLQKENNKLIKQLMAKLSVNMTDEKPILPNNTHKSDTFKMPKVAKETPIMDNVKK